MYLGIPAEVIEIMGDRPYLAMVSIAGVRREVNVALMQDEDLVPGDWVIVRVGAAVSRIESADAVATLQYLVSIGLPVLDELDGLAGLDVN